MYAIIPLCIFSDTGGTLKQRWEAFRSNNEDICHAEYKKSSVNSDTKLNKIENLENILQLTCPAIQIFHQQKEHWNCAQILHTQLCHASAVVRHYKNEKAEEDGWHRVITHWCQGQNQTKYQ